MIEIRDLSLRLGDFSLKNFGVRIEEGEYFVVLGPTGVGKTILLEAISGLQRPQSGTVVLGGQDITHLPPEKRGLGLVYQDYALLPHLDVRDNIGFGLRMRKVSSDERKTRVEAIAGTLGISDLLHREPETLSGGEQQRVALARALITQPKVCLLDEPLGALDPRTAKEMQSELKRVHREMGVTFVHVTHNFEEAVALGDRVGVMLDGRMVQIGPPEEVFNRPASLEVARFLGLHNILKGTVIQEDDGYYFSVGRVFLPDGGDHVGRECHLAIPPEDVVLSLQSFESSARNSLRGKITRITQRPTHVEVRLTIASGVEIVTLITKRSVEKLHLCDGLNVWATFKTTAVRVYS